MGQVTVRGALERVARNPGLLDIDDMIQAHVHDLIAASLFNIANTPGNSSRSKQRANTARGMILDRMVGRRRSGTNPARRTKTSLIFKDMTGGAIEGGDGGESPSDDEVQDVHPAGAHDVG